MKTLNFLWGSGLLVLLLLLSGCKSETAPEPLQQAGSIKLSANEKPAATTTVTPNTSKTLSANNTVYICASSSAAKYHLKADCRGLKRCKHTIQTVTLDHAEGRGLGLCGYED